MHALSNVGVFLVDTLFSLYLILLIVRFLLASSRADFYNPISQFIVQVTNPVLIPLRRVIPPIGKIDSAALVLILGLKLVQLILVLLLQGHSVSIFALIPLAVFKLLEMLIYIYIFALIVQAVMSWINPGAYQHQNPLLGILNSITRPILKPIRQVIPNIGMVDISPLVAILLLNVALILLRSFTLG